VRTVNNTMHFIDIVDTVTATVTATSPAHPLYLSVSIPPFKSYPLDVTLESLNLLITAGALTTALASYLNLL